MALILMVGMVAVGCSSAPHVSLATDQAAVNHWQSAVQQDQATLYSDRRAAVADGALCIPGSPTNGQFCNAPSDASDQAKLKSDQFSLQVAQDQLKKDEG
jgi:hypothetical protein